MKRLPANNAARPAERRQGPPPERIPIEWIRSDFTLRPDSSRVVIKPFLESADDCSGRIIDSVLGYDAEQAEALLTEILGEFDDRHSDFSGLLHERCRQVDGTEDLPEGLSDTQRMLLGAHFLSEYALESAALFNPSVVPHPNQNGVAEGCLRIAMSLRSIGEGHISSIEFRTGLVDPNGNTSIDPASGCVSAAVRTSNPVYRRNVFREILGNIEANHPLSKAVVDELGRTFTRPELENSLAALLDSATEESGRIVREIVDELRFLAECNYTVRFPAALPLSERILMPQSPSERNGIEDARFVLFTGGEPDEPTYYATYTAYNGNVTLPQLIETSDFAEFRMSTLGGKVATNKGMALFPRPIRGRFAALTRSDGCNTYLAYSDNIYHWENATLLAAPRFPWEVVKIGNCGSPIETDSGWLVITHGVGAMRKYSIGAMLLDLEDPSRVIARLPDPLIEPSGNEREGYVPNVVYTCGSLVHLDWLIIPYAMGDYATTVAKVRLSDLLEALLAQRD